MNQPTSVAASAGDPANPLLRSDQCDQAYLRDFVPYRGNPDPLRVWRTAWNSCCAAVLAAWRDFPRPPSAFVNAAGIKAMDMPGTVVRKLDAAFHDAVTFPRSEAFWAAMAAEQVAPTVTLTLEQARALAEALDIGQDAAGAEAAQYHEAMAGYRPERHKAMDEDVAKVKAAGALLGQLIQGAEGGSEVAHG